MCVSRIVWMVRNLKRGPSRFVGFLWFHRSSSKITFSKADFFGYRSRCMTQEILSGSGYHQNHNFFLLLCFSFLVLGWVHRKLTKPKRCFEKARCPHETVTRALVASYEQKKEVNTLILLSEDLGPKFSNEPRLRTTPLERAGCQKKGELGWLALSENIANKALSLSDHIDCNVMNQDLSLADEAACAFPVWIIHDGTLGSY